MADLDDIICLPPRIISTPKLGGTIKTKASDFIVSEIVNKNLVLRPSAESYNLPGKPGLFLHFVLIKNNIDTEKALNWVAKLWNVERNNFGIAGTKDKKALTAQRVSAWGVKDGYISGKLQELDFPSFKAKSLQLKLREIRLGNLFGNEFDILVRELNHTECKLDAALTQAVDEITDFGGIPNSFGSQRFGDIRPITHIVGKYLLRGDFREALRVYIGKYFENEQDKTKNARRIFWDNLNARESLDLMPDYLRIEKGLLSKLVVSPNDYKKAFFSLSFHLQKLFIHAYQSYLFNKYLKYRYLEYSQDFNSPIPGEKIRKKDAYAPILGRVTKLEGYVKEIYSEIIEEENINLNDFSSGLVRKLGAKGTYRSVLMKPNILRFKSSVDDLNNNNNNNNNNNTSNNKNKLRIVFQLKKGSYATIFLRELLG